MKKHILLSLLAVAGIALAADSIDTMVRKITGSNTPPTSTGSNLTAFALQDKSNNVVLNAYHGSLQIEGSTFNDHQTTLAFTEPTADRTITFQNATGTVLLTAVEARTVTAAGATTGTISEGTTHVTVTSDSAAKILILPAPVVGKQIVIHAGATGFELRSSDPATIAINGGSGADAESAIAANSTCFLTCVSATAWKGYFLDADSDVAKIEAAAP